MFFCNLFEQILNYFIIYNYKFNNFDQFFTTKRKIKKNEKKKKIKKIKTKIQFTPKLKKKHIKEIFVIN